MKSERERFGSILNFVSKTNMLIFLGTFVGKRKQTILKKRWFDITNSNWHSQAKTAQNWKKQTFDCQETSENKQSKLDKNTRVEQAADLVAIRN